MGWWLYLRDRNDGSRNDNGDWGWFRGHTQGIHDFLVRLGHTPPNADRYDQKLAEWFAENFPGGMLIEFGSGEGWTLAEVIQKPPKQVNRRIIRTVLRANRSFEKACAEHRANRP